MVYSDRRNTTRDNLMGLAGAGLGGYGGVLGIQYGKAALQRNNMLDRAYSLDKAGRKAYRKYKKDNKTQYQSFGDTSGKDRDGYYVKKKSVNRWGYTPTRLTNIDFENTAGIPNKANYDIGAILKRTSGGRVARGTYNADNWIDRNAKAVDAVVADPAKNISAAPAVASGKSRYKAAQKAVRKERRFLDRTLQKQGMNAMGGLRGDWARAQDFNLRKGFNKNNRKALLAGGRLAGGGLIGAGLGYGLGVASSRALNSLGWQG